MNHSEIGPMPPEATGERDIPEYSLEAGVVRLTDMVREKAAETDRPIVVEVAGGSASGKTSAVAAKIKDALGDAAAIFSMDDYYRGKDHLEAEAKKGNMMNWDQPEALDLERLKSDLRTLKEGRPIEKPVYSFKESRAIGTETVEPRKVVIVEGMFALNGTLAGEGDVKAFVDIGTHGRMIRRLLRDVERAGQRPIDILNYFADVVEPMHDAHVQSTRKNADIVIRNEYGPEIEAKRSGLHEIQLKFRADFDAETLHGLGAERLGEATQIDHYYDPKDRNLLQTGEMLRIRDEDGRHILTYKGPDVASEFRMRPKFEFEVDAETEGRLLSMYGKRDKVIKKRRMLYRLDGVTFSVDEVTKAEGGTETPLGTFVEIRSTDKEANETAVREVIKKLGVSPEEGIKRSYFEM